MISGYPDYIVRLQLKALRRLGYYEQVTSQFLSRSTTNLACRWRPQFNCFQKPGISSRPLQRVK